MTTSLILFGAFLLALYAERLGELVVSGRHARRLLAAGAREHGGGHFAAMALFHAVWPAAAWIEAWLLGRAFPGLIGWLALALALGAQGLRWWAAAALGPAWTVRVIVPPRPRPVTGGPYRFLRHPNYLAVVVEVLAVPAIHGAWLTLLVASVLNALLLMRRIPVEERALGRAYADAFAGRRRLLPEGRRDRP